jgi:hypothetical protein
MKLTPIALAAALTLCGSSAYAQSGAPSGAGSMTGDPARPVFRGAVAGSRLISLTRPRACGDRGHDRSGWLADQPR